MCSSGGVTPWCRHTTIGVEQISHSAIQQISSSWNHSVMRAASQRSQLSLLGQSVTGSTVRERLAVGPHHANDAIGPGDQANTPSRYESSEIRR